MHVRASPSRKISTTTMTLLQVPPELIQTICSNLHGRNAVNFKNTCRYTQEVLNPVVWNHLLVCLSYETSCPEAALLPNYRRPNESNFGFSCYPSGEIYYRVTFSNVRDVLRWIMIEGSANSILTHTQAVTVDHHHMLGHHMLVDQMDDMREFLDSSLLGAQSLTRFMQIRDEGLQTRMPDIPGSELILSPRLSKVFTLSKIYRREGSRTEGIAPFHCLEMLTGCVHLELSEKTRLMNLNIALGMVQLPDTLRTLELSLGDGSRAYDLDHIPANLMKGVLKDLPNLETLIISNILIGNDYGIHWLPDNVRKLRYILPEDSNVLGPYDPISAKGVEMLDIKMIFGLKMMQDFEFNALKCLWMDGEYTVFWDNGDWEDLENTPGDRLPFCLGLDSFVGYGGFPTYGVSLMLRGNPELKALGLLGTEFELLELLEAPLNEMKCLEFVFWALSAGPDEDSHQDGQEQDQGEEHNQEQDQNRDQEPAHDMAMDGMSDSEEDEDVGVDDDDDDEHSDSDLWSDESNSDTDGHDDSDSDSDGDSDEDMIVNGPDFAPFHMNLSRMFGAEAEVNPDHIRRVVEYFAKHCRPLKLFMMEMDDDLVQLLPNECYTVTYGPISTPYFDIAVDYGSKLYSVDLDRIRELNGWC